MSSFVARVLSSRCFTLDKHHRTFLPSTDFTYREAGKNAYNVVICIPFVKEHGHTLILCLDRHELLRCIMPKIDGNELFFTIEMDILRNMRFTEEEICKLGDDTLNFHVVKPVSGDLKDYRCGIAVKVISKYAF
jgi:hypothetical protein